MRALLLNAMKGALRLSPASRDPNSLLYALECRIAKELAIIGEFRWRGIGTFKVTIRPPMEGTHPATGEPKTWPEALSVSFRPSRKFKSMIQSFRDPNAQETSLQYNDDEELDLDCV